MGKLFIFCDASVNQKIGIGFGAFLILNEEDIAEFPQKSVKHKVQNVKFKSTSSTTLEIQTLLYILDKIDITKNNVSVLIYTDSQNICNLLNRRKRLEENKFISKSKNTEIKNTDLYRQFYQFFDQINFEIIKLKGHQKKEEKGKYHQIFTIVDRESRRVLRDFVKYK